MAVLTVYDASAHVSANTFCKSRIFRTHSISYPGLSDLSYAWNFCYSRWPLRISWLGLHHSHAFYFRTEATVPRTKYTKITCIRKILDLQYIVPINRGTYMYFLGRICSLQQIPLTMKEYLILEGYLLMGFTVIIMVSRDTLFRHVLFWFPHCCSTI